MSDKELRIGVIGAGGRGSLAAGAHKPEDNVRLVAGADIDEKALDAFKDKYGPDVLVTKDYTELLARKDIQAVFVTSPDFLHEEHAVAALKAGKDVYLEKPMAITIAGCDRILQTAREHGNKLYLGHNMRHMSFILKMKELIDSGTIGEVQTGWCRHFVGHGGYFYFKDWHAERKYSTSLLLQKAAHDIDILHWLCGGYTSRVNAMGDLKVYNRVKDRHPDKPKHEIGMTPISWPPLEQKGMHPIIDVEDISMMNMQLDNGVLCCYQQCHFTPDYWRNYTIIGTAGRIENFGTTPGQCVVRVWNKRNCGYNPYGDEQHFIPPTEGSHGGSDLNIVAEFVRYVRQGGKIKTSAIAARNSVAAGCAAAESLRNGGKPVDIPELPADLVEYFSKDINDRA